MACSLKRVFWVGHSPGLFFWGGGSLRLAPALRRPMGRAVSTSSLQQPFVGGVIACETRTFAFHHFTVRPSDFFVAGYRPMDDMNSCELFTGLFLHTVRSRVVV